MAVKVKAKTAAAKKAKPQAGRSVVDRLRKKLEETEAQMISADETHGRFIQSLRMSLDDVKQAQRETAADLQRLSEAAFMTIGHLARLEEDSKKDGYGAAQHLPQLVMLIRGGLEDAAHRTKPAPAVDGEAMAPAAQAKEDALASGLERYLDLHTVKEKGASVPRGDLYQDYCNWARRHCRPRMSQMHFNRLIGSRFGIVEGRIRKFDGLRMKTAEELQRDEDDIPF